MKFRLSVTRRFALVVASFWGLAANADVLVLKNGDRITGKINQRVHGEISIKPAYADGFSVDVEAVERVESDEDFDIDLESVVGTSEVKSEDEQIVSSRDARLDEPESVFDWRGHVDLSATVNKGNTDSLDSKLRLDTTVKFNRHRHIGELTFFREEQDGISNKEQDLYRYSYNWLFNNPWFFGAQLSYERDPIIELDSRVIGSAGIGLDIWDTPRRALSMHLGAGLQTEEIGMESEDSGVATWTLRYRQDLRGDDLELFHNHTITHNVTGRTNTSYKTSTGFRFEITDLFYANVSLDFDFETDPVAMAENEDAALVVGIGAEF